MTDWLIAKYMPDLRRREPQNIGVILFEGGSALARFVAEDPASLEIDGRTARPMFSSWENYCDWVHFWRSSMGSGPEKLLSRRAGENYFLERGGQVLAGAERDPRQLLDELYSMLVSEVVDEAPALPIEIDPIDVLFRDVANSIAVVAPFTVELSYDELTFDFAIKTDRTHLFKRVILNGNPKKTWEAVHGAVYSVESVAQSAIYQPHVLVAERDPGPSRDKQMKVLEHRVPGMLRKTTGGEDDRDWLLNLASAKILA